ncbi:MAG: InlB B-repeat-containing protein, partial [Treponema sp.]|nr:InlB B-repeat-containing protein [Treponema sp.]
PVTNYTVTFNANGGTPAPPTQTVRAGSNVTLPSGLTRSGYTFGGWNTRADSTGTNRAAGTSFTPTGNITLYARWETPPPPVPLNVRPGTPGTDRVTISWDSAGSGISYRVYWNTQNDPSSARTIGNPGTGTSMNITNLSSNTTYYFWVSSLRDGQESAKSSAVSVRTAPQLDL